MAQTIIVIFIIFLAAAFTAYRVYRLLRPVRPETGCTPDHCSSCPYNADGHQCDLKAKQ